MTASIATAQADEVVQRIEMIIRNVLALGDDVQLEPDAELITAVGIDSIEAFESVATLHEILGVRIPDDLDPKSISSIRGMANYLQSRYSGETLDRFMTMDIAAKLSELKAANDFE